MKVGCIIKHGGKKTLEHLKQGLEGAKDIGPRKYSFLGRSPIMERMGLYGKKVKRIKIKKKNETKDKSSI